MRTRSGFNLSRLWGVRALLGLAVALLVQTPLAARESPALAEVNLAALPREGRSVHAQILKGGPFTYAKDGATFGNFESVLPRRKRGYYREYTVDTPGARNRGARRIVCGAEAAQWSRNEPVACYYTDDHYATFRKIRS